MELHPAVAHLAPLLGTWRGGGRGDYPTIEAFDYSEEVTIGHVGKPFLAYSQRTKGAGGAPLHAESGYLRPDGESGLELLVVHPSGIAEVLVGEVTGTHFGLLVVLRAGAGHPAGPNDRARTGTDDAPAAEDPAQDTDDAPAAEDPAQGADTAGAAESEGFPAVGTRVGAGGHVILAPTAKRVDATERRISVDGDTMRYEVHMAAVGEPMTPHLEATLRRSD